jgi:hypothetical protein
MMGIPPDVPGKVVFNAKALENSIGAHNLPQFIALVGPVETRRHQDQDTFIRHPSPHQGLQEGGEERPVGDGPRDVANQDAGTLLAPGEVPQRLAVDRIFQGMMHCLVRVMERLHGVFPNHVRLDILGQMDRQPFTPVEKIHVHDIPRHWVEDERHIFLIF